MCLHIKCVCVCVCTHTHTHIYIHPHMHIYAWGIFRKYYQDRNEQWIKHSFSSILYSQNLLGIEDLYSSEISIGQSTSKISLLKWSEASSLYFSCPPYSQMSLLIDLVWFYGISTIVGDLMSNSVYTYISNMICKHLFFLDTHSWRI